MVYSARWVLATLFLMTGLVAVGDWATPIWVAMTLWVYAVPLISQFLPFLTVQIYGLWFGFFLILQTLMTPLLVDRDLFTLQPLLRQERDVYPGAIPGIKGVQRITTDEKGFRVTREIDYRAKPAGTLRIFAIGASTTEQIFLDDRKTWTHLLQEGMQSEFQSLSVEVINTGVSGLRVRHHIATFRHVARYSPDVALFLIGINDWNRHVLRSLAPGSLDKTGPRQERTRRRGLIGLAEFRKTPFGMALERLSRTTSIQAGHDDRRILSLPERGAYLRDKGHSLARTAKRSFKPAAVSQEFARELEVLADECAHLGIFCVFATQPTAYHPEAPPNVRDRFWMTPPYSDFTLDFDSLVHLSALYNNHLLDFAHRRGLASCDVAAEIPPSPEFFYDDCHFTVVGAERVSELLTECLRNALTDKQD